MTFSKRLISKVEYPGPGSTVVYVPDMSKAWVDTGVTAPFCKNSVVRVGSNYYAVGYNGSISTGNIWSAPVNDCTNWSVAGTLPDSKVIGFSKLAVVNNNLYIFGGWSANNTDNRRIFTAPIATPTAFTDTGSTMNTRAYEASIVITMGRINLLPSYQAGSTWEWASTETPTVFNTHTASVSGWEHGGMSTTCPPSIVKLTGYSSNQIIQIHGSVEACTSYTGVASPTTVEQYPIGYDAHDRLYFFCHNTNIVCSVYPDCSFINGNRTFLYSTTGAALNYPFGAHWICNGYFYAIHGSTRNIWRSARKALTCAFVPPGFEPFEAYNEFGVKEWVSRHVRLGYAPWFTNRFDI
jgi:hypothetical protein